MTGPGAGTPFPAAPFPPDPIARPEFYDGVTLRRTIAWFLDLIIVATLVLVLHLAIGIVSIVTLGLLWPLHLLVVPLGVALLYHAFSIASAGGGTLGMRLLGLEAWSVLGGRPNFVQAATHAVCLYGSMAVTSGLVALFALFNAQRRTLHDYLAGVVVLRTV